jgi:thiosulfate/3-mercaptopyruvate sulfurtransferase
MSVDALPPFVTVTWLRERLDADPDGLVLVDARWSLDGSEGLHTYLQGHLPGAVFVDLDHELSDPASPEAGRHPLPEPERFARDLGALGIGHDVPVVAYDQGPGVAPARLVWLLRAIGQPAAVLDGGLAAWDGPVTSRVPSRSAVQRDPVPWPNDHLVDGEAVAALTGDPAALLLDARDPARYAGDHEPVDPVAGHIPGARNAPLAGNLVGGRLRETDDLRERYDRLGTFDAEQVVAYCGSGVAACHDLLVLETLGVRGRLYAGSWSAWSQVPGAEVERGHDAVGPA